MRLGEGGEEIRKGGWEEGRSVKREGGAREEV